LFRSYVTHIEVSVGQGALAQARTNGNDLDRANLALEPSPVNEKSRSEIIFGFPLE
jgi:hypothetical protein